MWTAGGAKSSLVGMIYDWLNRPQFEQFGDWGGWKILWKLMTIPRVKVFLWRLLHGRTPTFAYLHKLNIGPDRECVFCGLERDTDEHFVWGCHKTRDCWNVVGCFAGLDLREIASFTDGEWLTMNWNTRYGNKCFKAVLASYAWLLWKARCNVVFKSSIPNFRQIGHQANDLVRSLDHDLRLSAGKLSFFPFNSALYLFTDAAWVEQNQSCGLGFVLANGKKKF